MNYILPLPKKDDDEAGWVDRLLVVARYLNKKEFKTFLSLTRLQERCVFLEWRSVQRELMKGQATGAFRCVHQGVRGEQCACSFGG